jgi:hypothetical protein
MFSELETLLVPLKAKGVIGKGKNMKVMPGNFPAWAG